MRTIRNCPSTLASGFSDYSPKAIKTLFAGVKTSCKMDFSFYNDDDTSGLDSGMDLDSQEKRIITSTTILSISGAQEKFPAVVDGGKIRIAQEGERSRFILKPAPLAHLERRIHIPANEHLTMQIASQVYGIETALNGICFGSDGRPVYITRRFDVMPDGNKLIMEDFASLIGKTRENGGTDYKYDGSYDEIAKAIVRNIPASKIALEKFFRLILFNYIFGNGDAHLKNFSIIRNGNDIRLAPAYDLLNTHLHIDGNDLGLNGGLSPDIEPSDVYDRTGHPCRLDFFRFALHIGINEVRANKILDEFMEFKPLVDQLIANSMFDDDRVRRYYKRIIEERRMRFIRKSE